MHKILLPLKVYILTYVCIYNICRLTDKNTFDVKMYVAKIMIVAKNIRIFDQKLVKP